MTQEDDFDIKFSYIKYINLFRIVKKDPPPKKKNKRDGKCWHMQIEYGEKWFTRNWLTGVNKKKKIKYHVAVSK